MPTVIDAKGKDVKKIDVPAVFSADHTKKVNVIFRAVFREQANPRSGTHSTLKRDEVRGGGRKPWKQKGTGRARQGSIRSPQWRHGGVVFGPQPRSYISSLNKKERRAAMVAALSDRYQHDAVTILSSDGLAIAKTREMATLLYGSPKAAKTGIRTLVVFAENELATVGENLRRAGGNLKYVKVTHTGELDVQDVIGYTRLVLTTGANDALTAKFEKGPKPV